MRFSAKLCLLRYNVYWILFCDNCMCSQQIIMLIVWSQFRFYATVILNLLFKFFIASLNGPIQDSYRRRGLLMYSV